MSKLVGNGYVFDEEGNIIDLPNPLTSAELAGLKAAASEGTLVLDHGGDCLEMRGSIIIDTRTILRLIDMIEWQREAFRSYACHTDGCFSPGVRCTCGFDEALATMVPQK